MIVGMSTHPSERRHDDSVREIDVSHSIWCEKWLIRNHMNSCIDRLNVLKKQLRSHRPEWDKTLGILRCSQLPHTVLRMSKRHCLNSLRRSECCRKSNRPCTDSRCNASSERTTTYPHRYAVNSRRVGIPSPPAVGRALTRQRSCQRLLRGPCPQLAKSRWDGLGQES